MIGRRGFIGALVGVAAVPLVGVVPAAEALAPIMCVKRSKDTLELDWFRFIQLPNGKWVSEALWRRNGGEWRRWACIDETPGIELPDLWVSPGDNGNLKVTADFDSLERLRIAQWEYLLSMEESNEAPDLIKEENALLEEEEAY